MTFPASERPWPQYRASPVPGSRLSRVGCAPPGLPSSWWPPWSVWGRQAWVRAPGVLPPTGWWEPRRSPPGWRRSYVDNWGPAVRSSREDLPLGGPGSGPLPGGRKLIDRSFYGVYTDPSKPPVIGDLAVLAEGLSLVGGVTLALN